VGVAFAHPPSALAAFVGGLGPQTIQIDSLRHDSASGVVHATDEGYPHLLKITAPGTYVVAAKMRVQAGGAQAGITTWRVIYDSDPDLSSPTVLDSSLNSNVGLWTSDTSTDLVVTSTPVYVGLDIDPQAGDTSAVTSVSGLGIMETDDCGQYHNVSATIGNLGLFGGDITSESAAGDELTLTVVVSKSTFDNVTEHSAPEVSSYDFTSGIVEYEHGTAALISDTGGYKTFQTTGILRTAVSDGDFGVVVSFPDILSSDIFAELCLTPLPVLVSTGAAWKVGWQ
jgi:hypothetical protein